MPHLRKVALLLLVLMGFSGVSQYKRTQLKYGVIGCPHVSEGAWNSNSYDGGVNTYRDGVLYMVDWLCDQGISVLIVDGDCTIGNPTFNHTDRMKAVFRSVMPPSVDLQVVAGNHDVANFDFPTLQGSNPYAMLSDSFSVFSGRSYWSKDYGSVRFIALNANTDTTYVLTGSYFQAYAENNPPYLGYGYWSNNGFPNGNNVTNPDFSGITSRTSAQYQWFKALLLDPKPTVTIVFSHRPPWSTVLQATTPSRAPNGQLRYKACALACSTGVDLWHTADIHAANITARIKSTASGTRSVNPADSSGIHYSSTCCSYVRRATSTAEMPAGSVSWYNTAAVDSGSSSRWVYADLVEIYGNRIRLRKVRTAQGPSPTFTLRTVVAAERVYLAKGARQ